MMAKGKDALLVEAPIDPLEALLSTEQAIPEDTVFIKRLGTNFTVKAPASDEYRALLKRCMVERGKGKNRTRELDVDKFQKGLVYTFTANPNLSDPKLQERYKCLAPEDIVDKALLPGEIEKLADKILDLGGYGDEDELVEEAKN